MASADDANQPFDQRLEFPARLAVVFVGIQRTHFRKVGDGVEATEAAFDADDDRSRDTIDGESRRRLFVAADRARRNLHCRVTRRIERHNALFVQT